MRQGIFASLVGVLLLLSGTNGYAANLTLQLGAAFGGDAFIDSGNDQDLAAGDVIFYGAAVDFDIMDDAFLRLGYSFRDGSSEFDDADEKISATQLDLLYMKFINNVVVGGGVTLHQSPEYEINLFGLGTLEQKFDDAMGFAGQLGFMTGHLELGVRVELIDYDAKGDFIFIDDRSVSANSFGIYLAYQFR